MSQSYPYLTLARRLCLKYGYVLAIVDELDKTGKIKSTWRGIIRNRGDLDEIYVSWMGERQRRRKVLADEDALSSDYHKSFIP